MNIPKYNSKNSKESDDLITDLIKINPEIPNLPTQLDKRKINIRYCLIVPFVSVHIYWNKEINEVVYEIEEPTLTNEETILLKEIEQGMIDLLNIEAVSEKNQEEIINYLNKTAKIILSELGKNLSNESYKRIFYYIYRDFYGFNEIESLLKDFFIEDIECNGANSPIYIVHRIYRNLRTNIIYDNIEELASFIEKIAQRTGRYVSYANPLLDGTLPDGSRVNATYTTDISSKGPTFTIRKFTKTPITPIQLLEYRTLSPEMLAYLWMLVQYKMNILITGGTGAGKTSLLNAIAFFIPPNARVISIEDTREINLPRQNWLPSVSRTGLGGIGEIDLFTLLKESFRQNPDYVIVGEVRGAEASVLFQGMASGHPSISTMHADSVDTIIKRLETPPINLSPTLINTLDVVAVMTHALSKKKDTRKLREISEILSAGKQEANKKTVFEWNPREDAFYFDSDSHVFEKISKRYGLTPEEIKLEFETRTKLIQRLLKNKIRSFHQIQAIVNQYYRDPEAVLKKYL